MPCAGNGGQVQVCGRDGAALQRGKGGQLRALRPRHQEDRRQC